MTVCSVVLLFFQLCSIWLIKPQNSNLMIILIAFSLSPRHRKSLSEHLLCCGQIQSSCSALSFDAICKIHFHKSLVSTSKMTSCSARPTPASMLCSRFLSELLSTRPECIRFYWECSAKNTGLPGWKCILMGAWTQRHVMICHVRRVT